MEFIETEGVRFDREERATIQREANQASIEVRRLLPELPRPLLLQVRGGTEHDVIPETGETAQATPPGTVTWTIDAKRPGGIVALVKTQLRPTLFHEFHHLARRARVPQGSLMEEVVSEGLATAFERNAAGVPPPWGQYPKEAPAWVAELSALPKDARRDHWLFRHPDGRRWIGLRAGTFLADEATRKTGKSAAALAQVPTDELLRMSQGP